MARTKRSTTRAVYQINVTLKGSKPPIWRRMQVTSETTWRSCIVFCNA